MCQFSTVCGVLFSVSALPAVPVETRGLSLTQVRQSSFPHGHSDWLYGLKISR